MYESLFVQNIILSPLAFAIYLLAAGAFGWSMYSLLGYRHWIKRLRQYELLPHPPIRRANYGYVEYIPEVVYPVQPVVVAPRRPQAPRPVKKTPAYSTKDDLKIIEGIGPKIETILNENGVYTWRELALTPTTHLKAMLERAGSQYAAHSPDTWPEQAALANQGHWDELKEFQDGLNSKK